MASHLHLVDKPRKGGVSGTSTLARHAIGKPRECADCGTQVWGDAGYCRRHYYERLKEGSTELAKIKMVVSPWVTLPGGIRSRTVSNP